jgi:hypothetical protein
MTVLCLLGVVFGVIVAGDILIDHRRHARTIAQWYAHEMSGQGRTSTASGRSSNDGRVRGFRLRSLRHAARGL